MPTDPYGHMNYTIGDPAGNVICFDFAVNARGTRVRIHSMVNCETGHFTENLANVVVDRIEAEAEAERQIDNAWEWFAVNGSRGRVVGKRAMAKFRRDLKKEVR